MTAETPLITGSSIGAVLRARYVPRLLSASLLGRLPTGMAPLAILLTVRGHGGDYWLAGVLAAAYAASAAVCGPVLGRLIDRTRQPPVLLASAALSAVAFLLLGVIDPVRWPLLGAAAAMIAGAATPQLEPCLRVLWEHVVDGERNVRAAYSLDAAAQELIFVVGPLLVLGATAFAGPVAGLGMAAAFGLIGSAWFATARPARVWRGAKTEAHWAGPMRGAGVIRLFAVIVCVGATIGAFTVGITGYAEEAGNPTSAGWLIALNAAGALVCGIAYTAAPVSRREDRRLLTLLVLLALGYLPLVFTPGIPAMAPLAFLSGCALPAVLASAFALIPRMAPQGTLTEAHAWMITSFGAGNALGSAIAGTLLDLSTASAAFVLATTCAAMGIALSTPRLLHDESRG